MEGEEEIVQLINILKQGRDDVQAGQGEDMAELYATEPVKLPANRMYFLVIRMSEMTCSAGEGGNYLHCLQTEKGGVQVALVTPEKCNLIMFQIFKVRSSSM